MTLSLLRDHLHKQVEGSKRLAGVSGYQMLENFEEEVEGKLFVKSEFESLVWELGLEEKMGAYGALINVSSCVYSFNYSEQFLSFIFQDVTTKIWASHMIFEKDISTGEVTDLMKYPIVLEKLTKLANSQHDNLHWKLCRRPSWAFKCRGWYRSRCFS
ncbi:hypothetical protein ACFX2G_047974 [Malus domestica]